jgi:hypothetical protein
MQSEGGIVRKIGLVGVLFLVPAVVATQSAKRAQILVLGTYHMASPGKDLFNSKVDDVMADKRQREMTEVIEALKRFRPTKIAIEAHVGSGRVAREYKNYLEGKYTLTANEIDQLGYRLAKELGHKTIYAVDEDGDFPFYRVRNYAIANGRKDQFEAGQTVVATRVKEQDAFLASHTILETLEYLNSDADARRAVGEYYTGFMPYGEPYEYAGPDLIASWFQRNLRIYNNVRALVTSPDDRILVIYGNGHLGWLRQIVSGDPAVQLRNLNEFTKRDGR